MSRTRNLFENLNLISRKTRSGAYRESKRVSKRSSTLRKLHALLPSLNPLEQRVLLTVDITQPSQLGQYLSGGTYSIIDPTSVTIDCALNTNGAAITIHSNSVTINGAIQTGGGAITLESGGQDTIGWQTSNNTSIAVNANLVTTSPGGAAGAITLSGTNQYYTLGGTGLSLGALIQDIEAKQNSAVTVAAGAQIIGGNVTIKSTAGAQGPNTAGNTSFLNKFESTLEHIGTAAVNFLLGLPISVVLRQPQASIDISGVIQSSGSVDVESNSTANAVGQAVWSLWAQKTKSPLQFAIGYAKSTATSTATLENGASITTTGGPVTIQTNTINTMSMKAFANSTSSSSGVGLDYAMTSLSTTSKAIVAAGSTITSSQNVSIAAQATDSNKIESKSMSFGGSVGAAASIGDTTSDVQAIVNGTIFAGSVIVPQTLTFNPSLQVNFATNTITFPTVVGFQTGNGIIYSAGGGLPIPGLTDGQTYYVINTNKQKQIQLASSQANAQAGIAVNLGASSSPYPMLAVTDSTGQKQTVPITLLDSVSNTIAFDFGTWTDGAPLFTNGQTVKYTPAAGAFIGVNDSSGNILGELPAGQYTVSVVNNTNVSYANPFTIQLVDKAGKVISLNNNPIFTAPDGTIYQVASFDSNDNLVDFVIPQDLTGSTQTSTPTQSFANLANAEALVYSQALGTQASGLVDGQTYYAIVDPTNPGIINLAPTATAAQAANPAVQVANPTLTVTSNQLIISSTTDTQLTGGHSTIQNPAAGTGLAQTLYNTATGGTFLLNLQANGQSISTTPLAYNAPATTIASAILTMTGVTVTVTGTGIVSNPWVITPSYQTITTGQMNIDGLQPGTSLVFNTDPGIADGTSVVYNEVPGKPVPGLVNGQTYYAYNQVNSDFNANFPQYFLVLQLTPDPTQTPVNFAIEQTFTNSASGQSFVLSGINTQTNDITIVLPPAPISSVSNANLAGATANLTVPSEGGFFYWNNATAGTFTFVYTDATGIQYITQPLAYNASAATVASALNGLPGISVQVTGKGTPTSPWLITGSNAPLFAVDSSALVNGSSYDVMAPTGMQSLSTTATSGSFTLTLNVNGVETQSPAIAWNASASQLTTVLETIPYIAATVRGTGTIDDPWYILTSYQPITTGTSAVFNDCWSLDNYTLVNGVTYYAMVSSTQDIPGTLSLTLAPSQQAALQSGTSPVSLAPTVDLGTLTIGEMSGSAHTFTSNLTASGVSVTATLNTTDSVGTKISIGFGSPTAAARENGKVPEQPRNPGNLGLAGAYTYISEDEYVGSFVSNGSSGLLSSNAMPGVSSNAMPNAGTTGSTHSFTIGTNLGLMNVTNTVQAIIGNTAVIGTTGSVNVNASITEKSISYGNAGVTNPSQNADKSMKVAAALALAITNYTNTAQAVIASNAHVTGYGGVNVASNVSYPYLIPDDSWKQIVSSVAHNLLMQQLGQLMQGMGGANNWVNAAAGRQNQKSGQIDFTLSGSIGLYSFNNISLAQIADGAAINQPMSQLPPPPYGAQEPVSINATTNFENATVGGSFYAHLAATQIRYGLRTGSGIFGMSTGNNTIGGTYVGLTLNNSTLATLGGIDPSNDVPTQPTQVAFGSGGLTVSAQNSTLFVTLVQGGGKSNSIGVNATVGNVQVASDNCEAMIQPPTSYGLFITSTPGTAGAVNVTSNDSSSLIDLVGSVLSSGNIGVGVSVALATLTRTVLAFIGTASSTPSSNAPPTSSTAKNFAIAGNVSVTSNASGNIVPVAVSGATQNNTNPNPNYNSSYGKYAPYVGSPKGQFGIGVSGSYAEATINDTVHSYVNNQSLQGTGSSQSLNVNAGNSTQVYAITGGLEWLVSKNAGNEIGSSSTTLSAGLQGSASVLNVTSSIEAWIASSFISSFAISVASTDTRNLGSLAFGLDGGMVSAKLASVIIEGSVALNQLSNRTIASLANNTFTNAGNISISASNQDTIWSFAGEVTFMTTSRTKVGASGTKGLSVGVGAGVALTVLETDETATVITNTTFSQVSGGLSQSATAAPAIYGISAGVNGTAAIPTVGLDMSGMYSGLVDTPVVESNFLNSTLTSSSPSTDTQAGFGVTSSYEPYIVMVSGDLGFMFNHGGGQVAIGVGVSVSIVQISGGVNLAEVQGSTVSILNGNMTVEATSGPQSGETVNLKTVAVAGSVSASNSTVTLPEYGAGVSNTVSVATTASINGNSSVSLTSGELSVTAVDSLTISSDAGGISLGITLQILPVEYRGAGTVGSPSAAIGIAVGAAYVATTLTNAISANIQSSTISAAGAINVTAKDQEVSDILAFGVALTVSFTDGSSAFAGAGSGAFAYNTLNNSVTADVSGSQLSTTSSVLVQAIDNPTVQTSAGSGSLAGSYGSSNSVSLSFGAIKAINTVTDTTEAYIGAQPSNSNAGTVPSGTPTTSVIAGGPVTVAAKSEPTSTIMAVAVAVSASVSGGGLSVAAAATGASAVNNLVDTTYAGINNNSNVMSLLSGLTQVGVNVTATDTANALTKVGAGATNWALGGSMLVGFGGALGISLAQTNNNDSTTAELASSTVTTPGSGVMVSATVSNSLSTYSVATSLSVSIGVAGAGGNSNISDSSSASSSVKNSVVTTGNSTSGYGPLAINASSQETLNAQIYAGVGGLGSIGVFMSTVTRGPNSSPSSGSTTNGFTNSSISGTNLLNVGNLTVLATSTQNAQSYGFSLTIGGLAGTGETHTTTITDTVSASVSGAAATGTAINTLAPQGDLSVTATANDTALAMDGGQNPGETEVNIGALGIGIYQAFSTVSPTVAATVQDVSLMPSGSVAIWSSATSSNSAEARCGAGSLIGGEATKVETYNNPSVTTTLNGAQIQALQVRINAAASSTYTPFADSISASVVGGSGATAINHSSPSVLISLENDTTNNIPTNISTLGSVTIGTSNNLQSSYDPTTDPEGWVVRVGGGGIVNGFGGASNSYDNGSSQINLGNGVSVSTALGGIAIGASQGLTTKEVVHMASGSVAGGNGENANLTANLNTGVNLCNQVTLSAPQGPVGIGTSVQTNANTTAYSYSFGLAGGSNSSTSNSLTSNQTVTLGSSTINAGGLVQVTAGQNPVTGASSVLNSSAIACSRTKGLIEIPNASASDTINSSASTTLGTGSVITGGQDVQVGSYPGNLNSLGYWQTFYNYSFSDRSNGNVGTSHPTSNVTLNGSVVAGNNYQLNLAIPAAGNSLTVNGGTPITLLPPAAGSAGTVVSPASGQSFFPFLYNFNTTYNPQSLQSALSPTDWQVLQSSLAQPSVTDLVLSGLSATGGQIIVNASNLSGSGTLTAHTPVITVNNASPNYLELDQVVAVNSLNMGQIVFTGTATQKSAPSLILNPDSNTSPVITINQTFAGSAGLGTSSGPGIIVDSGGIQNSGGSVTITNVNGPFIDLGPINASSVTVSTPNSAFIVDTPTAYYGSGGNIISAIQSGAQPLPLSDFVAGPSNTYFMGGAGNLAVHPAGYFLPGYVQYGTTSTGSPGAVFSADLVASTAEDQLYNAPSMSNGLYTQYAQGFYVMAGQINTTGTAIYYSGGIYGNVNNYSNKTGTGYLFFGSPLPYVAPNELVNPNNGQNGGYGYLDGQSNAISFASQGSFGILSSSTSYYTIGTGSAGSQGKNSAPFMGFLPMVLTNMPLSASSATGPKAGLSSGITAATVAITAAIIDLNAPINAGNTQNLSLTLSSALGSSLKNYQMQYQAGTQANPIDSLTEADLGLPNSGITATYNAQTNQITLSEIATSSSKIQVILTGAIMSTVAGNAINLSGGPGTNAINNQTGIPLVLSGVDSGASSVQGLVQINDTQTGQTTQYLYNPGQPIQKFIAPYINNVTGTYSTPTTISGNSTSYQPLSGQEYSWTNTAQISRQLTFTQGQSGISISQPANNGGDWGFVGVGSISGFGNTGQGWSSRTNGSFTPTVSNNVLTLTKNGVGNTANALWYNTPISVASPFTVQFTYQGQANGADGIAFVLQNAGTSALGNVGGWLGYSGISGTSAAYEMNLYNGHTQGTNFTTNGSTGTYNATGTVNIASGDLINVTLTYNPSAGTLTEILTDTSNGNTYSKVYPNQNLSSLLGSQTATIGFTGGDGGATSTQTISNFSLAYAAGSNPYVLTSQGLVLPSSATNAINLATSGSAFAEIVSSQVTAQTTYKHTFNSNSSYAYNFGGSTVWYWNYPTAISLNATAYLKADNPISINFAGLQNGSLAISSNAGIGLNGLIRFAGPTSISTISGGIEQTATSQIQTQNLTLNSAGDLGTDVTPLNVTLTSGSVLNATAANGGIYLDGTGSFALGTISTTDASPISLNTSGSLTNSSTGSQISGGSISLNAGSIGTASSPVLLQTTSQVLNDGSLYGGIVNATSQGSIYLVEAQGNLRVGSIASQSGVVSLSAPQGSIVNAHDQVNNITGSPESLTALQINNILNRLSTTEANNASDTVNAYEGSIDSSYTQYWNLLANGTASSGNYTLNSASIPLYSQAAGIADGTDSPTNAQVQAYTAQLYQNCVTSFQSTSAFGPNWENLPQFQAYDASYTFTLLPAQSTALTYGANTVFTSLAMLQLVALSPSGSKLPVNMPEPNIQAQQILLNASGSLGLVQAPTIIPISDIQNDRLTSQQKQLLALASQAGDLEMVGTNSQGNQLFYNYGSEPTGVTPTGVQVKFTKPLYINAGSGGVTAGAPGAIALTQTKGNLLVNSAITQGAVNITAQGTISEGSLPNIQGFGGTGSGWTAVSNGAVPVSVQNNSLTLTQSSTGNTANALWYNSPISVTEPLVVQFTYQCPVPGADGIALVFQNSPQGTSALGNAGGYLGYTGISGNSVAYEMNIYMGHTMGTNIASNGQTMNYNPIGSISLGSGNPINVTLTYDPAAQAITENLKDMLTGMTYSRVYKGINLAAVLGANSAILGFTGGDGGATSTQVISNFSLTSTPIQAQNLDLVAGGNIGQPAIPLAVQATGTLNVYTQGQVAISQQSGNLNLGQISATGAVAINAPGNILGADSGSNGAILGLGGNGQGWTLNAQNGSFIGISNNVLSLNDANQAISQPASAWYNTPLPVTNGFIASFVYQNQGSRNGLTFAVQTDSRTTAAIGDASSALGYGTNGTNPAIQPSAAFEINAGANSSTNLGVGVGSNGSTGSYQTPGSIILNSGDPIQVVLTYSAETHTFTQSLTDTTTGATFSSTVSNVDLLRILGKAKAIIGFTAADSPLYQAPAISAFQSISNFSISYGAPNISTGSTLNLASSNGEIGTRTNPLLINAQGSIVASAPQGINLIQTNGDLLVNSVTTTGTASLAAANGSVVNSTALAASAAVTSPATSPSNQVTPLALALAVPLGQTQPSLVATPGTIQAGELVLQATTGLGTAKSPLVTKAGQLIANAGLGSVVVLNKGILQIGQQGGTAGLQAANAITLFNDSTITVASSVLAGGPITLRGISSAHTSANLSVLNQTSIVSQLAGVVLEGSNGVSLAAGSQVMSNGTGANSLIQILSNAPTVDPALNNRIQSLGQLAADQILFGTTATTNNNISLNLNGISGRTLDAAVNFLSNAQINSLTIDDSQDTAGRTVTIANGELSTPKHTLNLNAMQSLVLNLGSGNDNVHVGDGLALKTLQINTGQGADTIQTTLSNPGLQQTINSGSATSTLAIDSAGQNSWASTGKVESMQAQVLYQGFKHVSVQNTPTLNGLPVSATGATPTQPVTTGIQTNTQFVQALYQEILGRQATTKELKHAVNSLNSHGMTRFRLAEKLTTSSGPNTNLVNAWYQSFLGRPATAAESSHAVLLLAAGRNSTQVLAGILSSGEFLQRTLQLQTHGSTRTRFLTGLYQLAVSPSATMPAATLRNLASIYNREGRSAAVLAVLNSSNVAQNQAAGYAVLLHQQPLVNQSVPAQFMKTASPRALLAWMLSRK